MSGTDVTEVIPSESEEPGSVGPAVVVPLEIGYGTVYAVDELTPPDTLEVTPPDIEVLGSVGPAVAVEL